MKIFKHLALTSLLMVTVLGLMACGGNPASETATKVNAQTQIAGLQLGMTAKDAETLLGSEYETVPCVIGEEHDYAAQNLTLVIDLDSKTVKRITTKNPEHTVFSLTIGQSCAEGTEALTAQGFAPDGSSKTKFVAEDVRITLISIAGQNIDGFTVETIDQE